MRLYSLVMVGSRGQGFTENSRRCRLQCLVLATEEVIGPRDRHNFGIVLVVLPLLELRKVNERVGIADDDSYGQRKVVC